MTDFDNTHSFAHNDSRPDRNLGMELVRATEAAAIKASAWIGRGDKNAADGAAVAAMRDFLNTVDFAGTIVIGEGEKDEAPMLANGEEVGNGHGPECDIAVDPVDGTSVTAAGRAHAISVIAVSDKGSMYNPKDVFYMDKLITTKAGKGVVSLDLSPAENVRELAKALKKDVSEITVAMIDRPRHRPIMDEVRADEQLGLPVRQLAHRMRFPNFLEQGLGHLSKR